MFTLRPYQEEARQIFRERLPRARTAQVLALPTGAGKTLTANTIALDHLSEGGRKSRVLWVALNWELLAQASANFARVAPRRSKSRRFIGSAKEAIPEVRNTVDAGGGRVFYTTLQTLGRRIDAGRLSTVVKSSRRLLVVYDECHWAANSKLGRQLLKRYLGTSKIMGLSATPPRLENGKFEVAFARSYADLSPEYLVEPVVEDVWTGVAWKPLVTNGYISPKSLAELGNNEQRDATITGKIIDRWQKSQFKRLIVFASAIEQAKRLKRVFGEANLPAGLVHSGKKRKQNAETIKRFRHGHYSAIINIAMLTEGFDLPEVDAIAVTHPVGSRTKMLQIIGRGSRPAEGKNRFLIFEFVDNVGSIRNQLIYPSDVLSGSSPGSVVRRRPTRGPVCHSEPDGEPQFENLALPGMEAVGFAVDQTFGVEMEITGVRGVPRFCGQFKSIGQRIVDVLSAHTKCDVHPTPINYGRNKVFGSQRWYVAYDSSAGWEVISPILKNHEGFVELKAATDALELILEQSPELKLNHRTGLHITLATRLQEQRHLRGFVARLQRLEPGLFTLVSPSRLYQFTQGLYDLEQRNSYCNPVREITRAVTTDSRSNFRTLPRHCSVNLRKAWGDIQLLEVRMHSGSIDFSKIAPWISLWMLVFNTSRYNWQGAGAHGAVFPGGDCKINSEQAGREDIFKLLEKENIALSGDMQTILHKRRRKLANSWRHAIPHRVASWREAGWYNTGAGLILSALENTIQSCAGIALNAAQRQRECDQ